jgi:hypothetical protein
VRLANYCAETGLDFDENVHICDFNSVIYAWIDEQCNVLDAVCATMYDAAGGWDVYVPAGPNTWQWEHHKVGTWADAVKVITEKGFQVGPYTTGPGGAQVWGLEKSTPVYAPMWDTTYSGITLEELVDFWAGLDWWEVNVMNEFLSTISLMPAELLQSWLDLCTSANNGDEDAAQAIQFLASMFSNQGSSNTDLFCMAVAEALIFAEEAEEDADPAEVGGFWDNPNDPLCDSPLHPC